MTDDATETMDGPVCGGDGFMACDDGSEVQCDRCNRTGRVPIEGDVQASRLIHESGHQPGPCGLRGTRDHTADLAALVATDSGECREKTTTSGD
jgi:hypothetical protein